MTDLLEQSAVENIIITINVNSEPVAGSAQSEIVSEGNVTANRMSDEPTLRQRATQ